MKKPCSTRDRSTARRRIVRGFTLVEMMVTLAVLATTCALAIAAWSSTASSMKLSAVSNSFLSQLQLARSEAIKRNMRVAMCKSADGSLCAASGGWEQGWIVFNDANDNGRRDLGEMVLSQAGALPSGYRLLGNTNVARYLSFAATGGTLLTSGAFQAGTLTLCKLSTGAADAREIIISAVGRPRIRKTTVASCA